MDLQVQLNLDLQAVQPTVATSPPAAAAAAAAGGGSQDPFTNTKHLCRGESCLGELQIQLAIVFAAKTTGKQIMYTLRPLIYKQVRADMRLNRHSHPLSRAHYPLS